MKKATKNKNLIIRISEEDNKSLKYLSKNYKINISELIRKIVKEIKNWAKYNNYTKNYTLEELIKISKTKWLDDID